MDQCSGMDQLDSEPRGDHGAVSVSSASSRQKEDRRAHALARSLAQAVADLQYQRDIRFECAREPLLESLELIADGRPEGPEGINI